MNAAEIQAFAAAAGGTAAHVWWSGTPRRPPVEYGWVVRIPGHTTPAQRDQLRAAGFRFRGGAWGRKDPV